MGTTISTAMQGLGEIEQRTPTVSAKKCGVSRAMCFFCHAPRPARCSFEGVGFVSQVLCRCLWVDFDAVFSVFFPE